MILCLGHDQENESLMVDEEIEKIRAASHYIEGPPGIRVGGLSTRLML